MLDICKKLNQPVTKMILKHKFNCYLNSILISVHFERFSVPFAGGVLRISVDGYDRMGTKIKTKKIARASTKFAKVHSCIALP